MSDILFGGEKSGTPLETRAGTGQMANLFSNRMRQGAGTLGAESFANMFGISPGEAGVGDIIKQMLTNPANRLEGLFSAMEPFERRQTNQAVSGVRNMFGTAGGRFSRNLGEAEAQTRGELSNQFARTRQEGILGAQGQQANFLAQLFQLANQAGLGEMDTMARFFQPGAPVYTEGLIPGLIGAAGNIFSAMQFNKGKPGGIPSTPNTLPPPDDPFRPGGSGWGGQFRPVGF